MLWRRVGNPAFSGITLAVVLFAVMVWKPAHFGFHRLNGVTELPLHSFEATQDTEDRTIVKVKVTKGLCGGTDEEITLQAIFNHYGIQDMLKDRAIYLNFKKRPKVEEDRKFYMEQVLKVGRDVRIPVGVKSEKKKD